MHFIFQLVYWNVLKAQVWQTEACLTLRCYIITTQYHLKSPITWVQLSLTFLYELCLKSSASGTVFLLLSLPLCAQVLHCFSWLENFYNIHKSSCESESVNKKCHTFFSQFNACLHCFVTVFQNCGVNTELECFIENRLWKKYGAEVDFNASAVKCNFPHGSSTCVIVFFV